MCSLSAHEQMFAVISIDGYEIVMKRMFKNLPYDSTL